MAGPRSASWLIAWVSAVAALTLPVSAADDYAEGVKLYQSKNYKSAAARFELALKAKPGNANALYYCALSHQMSGNRARARQLFEYIAGNFSSSPVAGMAETALRQLGGAPGATAPSASSDPASQGEIPERSAAAASIRPVMTTDEVRIPFQRLGKGVYVEVQLNGRPVRMHLDTGAGTTLIGQNQLDAIGVARPPALQQHGIGGVGDRTDIKGWKRTVDLKVGPIYVANFPITVQDHLEGEPLLGQTFLSNFFVTIDDSNQQVVFRKKTSKTLGTTKSAMNVPFSRGPGGHMLVNTEVNGKPYVMYFDTGADGIAFTFKDLKALRIELPEGAAESYSQGVAGTTKNWSFTIEKLKLGPIVKENVEAHVVERSDMDHPLLGQTFFGDYEYTIDNEHRQINFKPPK